jgi:DNA primase
VNYDPDSAGVAATDRSLTLLLEQGMTVKVLRLSGGLDPDAYIARHGAEAYRAALAAAPLYFHYLTGRALELHGKATLEAKLAGLNFLLPYLSRVPNALIRSELLADIAQKMEVQTGAVWEVFRKAGMGQRTTVQEPPGGLTRVPSAEAMLIRLLLEDEQAREEVALLLTGEALVEEMECAAIISSLLSMVESGRTIDLAGLADRLAEREQRLLAELAFNREARPVSRDEVDSYVFALQRKRLLRQRGLLQQRIQEAEKARDSRLAVQLLEEQRQLDRKLGALL